MSLSHIKFIFGVGALTYAVLDEPKEGKRALANISKYLKQQGLVLLSGKTASLLTSKPFKKAGFSVLNKCAYNEKIQKGHQFYILKKS